MRKINFYLNPARTIALVITCLVLSFLAHATPAGAQEKMKKKGHVVRLAEKMEVRGDSLCFTVGKVTICGKINLASGKLVAAKNSLLLSGFFKDSALQERGNLSS